MEIKGKVLTLFPVKEGVGKTSGTPWKSREFVIETQDQYPKRICLQVMNDNMDRFPMEEGMEVSVKFDISAREWDALLQHADGMGHHRAEFPAVQSGRRKQMRKKFFFWGYCWASAWHPRPSSIPHVPT